MDKTGNLLFQILSNNTESKLIPKENEKMFKKSLAVVMAILMLFSLCACQQTKNQNDTVTRDENEPTPLPIATPEPTAEPLHTTNYSESEVTEKVTIVVDGKEITPTDNNGETVETIIHDGVVYLPVKTVADATGKAYYWDGPEYTVYLGDMDGALEYPTVEIEKMTSIGHQVAKTERLTDNYGNRYSRAIYNNRAHTHFDYLLNMKYSSFKGTLYIPEGVTSNATCFLRVIADGTTIYTSPEMNKASAPVDIDVNVTGYNDVKIEFSNESSDYYNGISVCLGDAGFYQ